MCSSFIRFLQGQGLHCMWDPSSPNGSNPWPLHWQHRVLTTGLPGKSGTFIFFFFCTFILNWEKQSKIGAVVLSVNSSAMYIFLRTRASHFLLIFLYFRTSFFIEWCWLAGSFSVSENSLWVLTFLTLFIVLCHPFFLVNIPFLLICYRIKVERTW